MGVLEAYYRAINGCELAGPTYFYTLFKKVKNQIMTDIQENGKENRIYHVVIIITDGSCHDMQETKKILVEMTRNIALSVDQKYEVVCYHEKIFLVF